VFQKARKARITEPFLKGELGMSSFQLANTSPFGSKKKPKQEADNREKKNEYDPKHFFPRACATLENFYYSPYI
tara:strand:- start:19626 stop:19847 length:222 start_codon:yes stop_codon:yes gene_type:complete